MSDQEIIKEASYDALKSADVVMRTITSYAELCNMKARFEKIVQTENNAEEYWKLKNKITSIEEMKCELVSDFHEAFDDLFAEYETRWSNL